MLRVGALCVAYGSAVFWVLGGANRGWTKTSVTRWELDAVTGIKGPVTERKFVPGVEFLAGGFLGAVVLFGFSFVGRKK